MNNEVTKPVVHLWKTGSTFCCGMSAHEGAAAIVARKFADGSIDKVQVALHVNCAECLAKALGERAEEEFAQRLKKAPGEQVDVSHGMRFNAAKRRMDLISAWAMEGLADVLTFGAKKYAAWNWAKGLSWSETVGSLERHLAAFKRGEELDAESGLPHIHHVLCNAMFLAHFFITKTGSDDRFKGLEVKS